MKSSICILPCFFSHSFSTTPVFGRFFSIFCFKCKDGKPAVPMEKNGTMVTIYESCSTYGPKSFKWQSQPFLLGRHPAGNVLLCCASLAAAASVSKVLLVFKHMGLSAYSASISFLQQKCFIFSGICIEQL